MKISDIDYELSVRLGDPVSQIGGDGAVFSGIERLKYITRAYSKLTRMSRILMRDYQPEFNKMREVSTNNIDKGESEVKLRSLIKLDEVFVNVTYKDGGDSKTAIKPCSYMEPSKYLSNKYDVNETKATSFSDLKFKYTLMAVNYSKFITVMLLPLADADNYYTSIEAVVVPDLYPMSWESEVPLTSEYSDILINLAAIQGMQDIARADKAQLIERDIDKDWQILGQYGSYMKQTEGVKE